MILPIAPRPTQHRNVQIGGSGNCHCSGPRSFARPIIVAVLLIAASAAAAASPPPSGVLLVSLDGLGYQIWSQDPVAAELTALREIADSGVVAAGVQPAFPSSTANSHAAIWTGCYGDRNGLTANDAPIAPRAEHSVLERRKGYLSDGLIAEPIWVTAARQGVRVVANQVTQGYPFLTQNTGGPMPLAPVVINGYQTRTISKHRVVKAADVTAEPEAVWRPVLPASAKPVRYFCWTESGFTLHAALAADSPTAYNRVYLALDPRGGPRVSAIAAALEDTPPRQRALARNFSDGLPLEENGAVAGVVYFRLFEVAPDGADFLLYQTAVQELALYDGSAQAGQVRAQLLREAGGFLGNGPVSLMVPGAFGATGARGGDGTSERRYLEAAELLIRQSYRQAQWLARHYDPQLFINYLPFPDEADHEWLGRAAQGEPTARACRTWIYAAINCYVHELAALAGPADHVLFVSDHGMAPVTHHLRVNRILQDAGLLTLTKEGRIDAAHSQASYFYNSILVHTDDWQDGKVPRGEKEAVIQRVESALGAVSDPATGRPVITQFFHPEKVGEQFGIRGETCGDLYFDFLPGFSASADLTGRPVEKMEVPRGVHGFYPLRPDMLSSLIGRGPKLPQAAAWPRRRSIDIAPLVADLLGIAPPAQSHGISPLR
jgi:hypothetical protein